MCVFEVFRISSIFTVLFDPGGSPKSQFVDTLRISARFHVLTIPSINIEQIWVNIHLLMAKSIGFFNALFRIDQLTGCFVCLYLWTLNCSIFTVVFGKCSIFTVVFENARYLPWFSKTLDIYRAFRKRTVFYVCKTRFARYLP